MGEDGFVVGHLLLQGLDLLVVGTSVPDLGDLGGQGRLDLVGEALDPGLVGLTLGDLDLGEESEEEGLLGGLAITFGLAHDLGEILK